MTLVEIQDVLIKAWQTSRVVRVDHYLSASTGRLANLTVKLGGPTGYRDTVAEQLLKDNQTLDKVLLDKLRQHNVSVGVYSIVVEGILEKWRELIKEDMYVDPKQGWLDLDVSKAFWMAYPKGGPVAVLLHTSRLSEEVIEPGKSHSHLNSPKEEVRAREIFLQSTALRDYVPRLNLSSTKLKTIAVI